ADTTSIALSGTGLRGALDVSPAALAFTDVQVGQTAGPLAITLANNGTAPASLANLASSDPAYSFTTDCGASIPMGASCAISVTFEPTAAGQANATLSFETDATANTTSIVLTGTGLQGALQVSPTSLSFGEIQVGQAAGPLAVTLVNSGSAPASLANLASSNPAFSFTTDCGAALGVGESCAISVTFEPTAAGQVNATLSFDTDATANTTSIALAGTGLQGALDVSPIALAFGDVQVGQAAGPLAVTLVNNGSAPASLANLASSNPAFPFTPDRGAGLPVGA